MLLAVPALDIESASDPMLLTVPDACDPVRLGALAVTPLGMVNTSAGLLPVTPLAMLTTPLGSAPVKPLGMLATPLGTDPVFPLGML